MKNAGKGVKRELKKYFRNFVCGGHIVFVTLLLKLVMVPTIVHEGIVTAIDAGRRLVCVALADAGAESCASCAAAMLCKRKDDVLALTVTHPERFKPGERVRVVVDASSHRRAVGLLIALPALMLLLPLCTLSALGMPEWVALIAGVACCAITYGVLWLCRRRLNSADIFHILSD